MFNALSEAAYDAAIRDHAGKITSDLHRLRAAIQRGVTDDIAGGEVTRLKTTRVLLMSGLFDADFYSSKYPDISQTGLEPLEHYVRHGDAERRMPNAAFLPGYYRREYMKGISAEDNALRHYVAVGEASGGQPNPAFDPQVYLAANPPLRQFADRPLFHYLAIGQHAPAELSGMPPAAVMSALQGIEDPVAMGNELAFMAAKRALVDWLGIADGFAVYQKLIDRPDHSQLHGTRLGSLKDAAEKRPGAFRLTAASQPFVVPPPAVIGEGGVGPLAAVARSMYVACLIDARVHAGSEIIEVDDLALLDDEGDNLADFDFDLDWDSAIFHVTQRAAWIIAPQDGAETAEFEQAFTLLGEDCFEFGHWILEYLPKYIAAVLSGALPGVPVLMEAGLPKTYRQALELMLPDDTEIIELPRFATARVRRLWCAPRLASFPVRHMPPETLRPEVFVMPPARYAPVIREMARRADRACAQPTGVDRVFLAREPSSPHALANQAAVASAAESRGFLVVYAHRLDFVEQVHLVRHARLIVGPSGGAMFLAFFAKPGTKLCMFRWSADVTAAQTDMTGLFSEIGIDVTVFTGRCARLDPCSWNSDFESAPSSRASASPRVSPFTRP